jgi:hypothetical protein
MQFEHLVVAAAAASMLAVVLNVEDDFGKLLIHQKTCKIFLRIYLFGLLWFACGICTRSRISPCISWHSDDNQALLVS